MWYIYEGGLHPSVWDHLKLLCLGINRLYYTVASGCEGDDGNCLDATLLFPPHRDNQIITKRIVYNPLKNISLPLLTNMMSCVNLGELGVCMCRRD